ncbi:hypothetical protein DSM14862_02118 [Sulfitobacter indolifex]|uniref:Lipoprotein n=1 Tax=Sulfitobacter indolifex HEL-45 TaxID=391624 RepID=A0ABP2D8D2_9RHOB|nr:hypothetical protein OIHEL45_16179 [Sulfitobacter indolifex HEL-45]UOA19323.1 hypothetical protein DSM14862_02118 [Sulfitobacter indolifex]
MRLVILSLMSVLLATSATTACNIVNGRAHGDCAGVTVNIGRTAYQVVNSFSLLSGVSEGAQVLSGGSLRVSGLADHVVVERGGTAYVSGIVKRLEVSGAANISGQVTSIFLRDGGRVAIEGIVGDILGDGTAVLEAGSVIGGHLTEVTQEVAY